MRRSKHQVTSGEDLFIGIDLHKIRWHVTIRTFDLELSIASIPRTWEAPGRRDGEWFLRPGPSRCFFGPHGEQPRPAAKKPRSSK
jgi:hypothetical protein